MEAGPHANGVVVDSPRGGTALKARPLTVFLVRLTSHDALSIKIMSNTNLPKEASSIDTVGLADPTICMPFDEMDEAQVFAKQSS